jgi:hypothetical protein
VQIKPAPPPPRDDGKGHIGRPGREIDHADVLSRLPAPAETLEVRNRRARVPEQRIDATDEAQAVGEDRRVDVRRVHPLRFAMTTLAEIVEKHRRRSDCGYATNSYRAAGFFGDLLYLPLLG